MNYDIKYSLGDLIQYKIPVYYDDEPCIVKEYKTKEGYIFAIEIDEPSGFASKATKEKGYSIRYKAHKDKTLRLGWDYVNDTQITKLLEK
jgi:hypothetical protein